MRKFGFRFILQSRLISCQRQRRARMWRWHKREIKRLLTQLENQISPKADKRRRKINFRNQSADSEAVLTLFTAAIKRVLLIKKSVVTNTRTLRYQAPKKVNSSRQRESFQSHIQMRCLEGSIKAIHRSAILIAKCSTLIASIKKQSALILRKAFDPSSSSSFVPVVGVRRGKPMDVHMTW